MYFAFRVDWRSLKAWKRQKDFKQISINVTKNFNKLKKRTKSLEKKCIKSYLMQIFLPGCPVVKITRWWWASRAM